MPVRVRCRVLHSRAGRRVAALRPKARARKSEMRSKGDGFSRRYDCTRAPLDRRARINPANLRVSRFHGASLVVRWSNYRPARARMAAVVGLARVGILPSRRADFGWLERPSPTGRAWRLPPVLGRNEAGANREPHQTGDIANVQAVHDLRAMRIHGFR